MKTLRIVALALVVTGVIAVAVNVGSRQAQPVNPTAPQEVEGEMFGECPESC